jgi:hypothetical protein
MAVLPDLFLIFPGVGFGLIMFRGGSGFFCFQKFQKKIARSIKKMKVTEHYKATLLRRKIMNIRHHRQATSME